MSNEQESGAAKEAAEEQEKKDNDGDKGSDFFTRLSRCTIFL